MQMALCYWLRKKQCYRMEMNVKKSKAMKISRHPPSIQIVTDRECGIFEDCGQHDNERCKTAKVKAAFTKKQTLFTANWT